MASTDTRQLARLLQLARLRRDRVAAQLEPARQDLVQKLKLRDEQQALIDGLQHEIAALDKRSEQRAHSSLERIQLAATRRRLLVNEYEKEVFYIGAMESDVCEAQEVRDRLYQSWQKLVERVSALEEHSLAVRRKHAQARERRASALTVAAMSSPEVHW